MSIERIHGIVIDIVRHNDRHNVVTLYTRERGRVAFLSPASQGKAGRLRNARLQPLAAIAADVNFKGSRELQILGAVTPIEIWRDIYFNPAKSAIAMFLSEFLNTFLRQSEPDASLWDFIFRSVASLDAARGSVANRHIAFLIGLLPHAGIQPDISDFDHNRLQWFDMRGGSFTPGMPPHNDRLDPPEANAIPLLSRITARNASRFRFSGADRRRILLGIIRYYSVHYPGLGNLKSPAILAETFA